MSKIILTAEELNMIQTLRNAKAQTSGIESTNDGATSTSRRTHKVQPVYQVITKARHAFVSQLTKDGNVKRRCLEDALNKCSVLYPDTLRFSLDYHSERERLVDSKSFCRECEALGLIPSNVADHVVFEGKANVNKVLQEGLQAMGEKVYMFNCPLWKDTESLYNKEGDNA